MKKYGKLMISLVIICSSFLLFMYDVYAPYQEIPSYTIETVQGDGKVMQDVKVNGFVSNDEEDLFTDISFTDNKKGATLPFYRRFQEGSMDPSFMQQLKDYRSFMRLHSVYNIGAESADYLAYIDYDYHLGWHDFTSLELDVLDKKTGKSKSFMIDLKEELQITDANIETIELADDKAYLAVSSYDYDEEKQTDEEAYYLLGIDINTGTVEEKENMLTAAGDVYGDGYRELIRLKDPENEGIIFALTQENYDDVGEALYEEVIYASYVSEGTDTIKDLPLENWSSYPFYLQGDQLTFTEETENGTQIQTMNITSGEIEKTEELEGIYLDEHTVEISDEQIVYVAGSTDRNGQNTSIYAFTFDSWEPIYTGEVKAKDGKKAMDYDLYISALYHMK